MHVAETSKPRSPLRTTHISMTPGLSPMDWLSRGNGDFPTTVNPAHRLSTYNGSAAIYQMAVAAGIEAGDAVLLPAYCCGAEIGPFQAIGCELHFFDVNASLNVSVESLNAMLETYPKIKAVLITHYFGFAQKEIEHIMLLCQSKGVQLFEDCAHALYSYHNAKPLGSIGHFAVFSPRKSLPLTEGGVLVRNAERGAQGAKTVALPGLNSPDYLPRLQRALYSMQQGFRSTGSIGLRAVGHQSMIGLLSVPAGLIKVLKRVKPFSALQWATPDIEGLMASCIFNTSMSSGMANLLKRTNAPRIRSARRDNYETWLSALAQANTQQTASADRMTEGPRVRPVFDRLPEGCCPLYFPVFVDNPATIVKLLANNDVEAFNWWQYKHEAVNWSDYPVAAALKQQVVALPVHQKLNAEQIGRTAALIVRLAHEH